MQGTGTAASVYAFGGLNWSGSSDTKTPESCDWLCDLNVLDISCADKQIFITNHSGNVYESACGTALPDAEQMVRSQIFIIVTNNVPNLNVVDKSCCQVCSHANRFN